MRIIIIGFGNLGRGICRAFVEKADFLKRAHGLVPRVVAVADEFGAAVDEKGLDLPRLLKIAEGSGTVVGYPGGKRGKLALDLIDEVSADVVFELTPTNIRTGEPGLSHIKRAMQAGKHVITSNKGPLVVAFKELDALAKKQGVEFRYSASVGGAVPVIGLAKKLLSGNEISEIRGVLNGTTNYILTRMSAEGLPQEIIIREAQELGLAEKDPTLDIDGIDTACKVTILANSVLGINAKLSDVKVVGIRRITPEATRLAHEAGQMIKLVGIARRDRLEVGPKLVPQGHPLAVGGTLNAVTFKLDLAGEISITGFGAGPKETSSSLLGDLIDIHRTLGG
ncbi:MAG: homoserine dehydrogenase [Candidatus Hadarchaeum yellowstonense]|jgi:homoserine dehydrogenase|uniref:Homoserine dehydrogenase n=1 Tax=Hadarchaeum yellowstonense TaxID=1776334 RepID=A0A147K1L0_HADYE|nr:MAG: homoserine dehydrogenase [Candidatus Hadarchaeum yellowstonense]